MAIVLPTVRMVTIVLTYCLDMVIVFTSCLDMVIVFAPRLDMPTLLVTHGLDMAILRPQLASRFHSCELPVVFCDI